MLLLDLPFPKIQAEKFLQKWPTCWFLPHPHGNLSGYLEFVYYLDQLDGFSSYLECISRCTELKYSLCDIYEIHLLGRDRDRSKSDFYHRHFSKHLQRLICNQIAFGQLAVAVLSDISGCRDWGSLGTTGVMVGKAFHRSLQYGVAHLWLFTPRDGLVCCWKYWITLGWKLCWGRKSKRCRRGGFLPLVPEKLRYFKEGVETDSLTLRVWEKTSAEKHKRDQATWDWDILAWYDILRDQGANCRAGCPGCSVLPVIWDHVWIEHCVYVFFSFPARFSETVESKCSGIWAPVNDNKCIVYSFFLGSWKLHYHMAGYKITPPLFYIVKWVLKDDGNTCPRN